MVGLRLLRSLVPPYNLAGLGKGAPVQGGFGDRNAGLAQPMSSA